MVRMGSPVRFRRGVPLLSRTSPPWVRRVAPSRRCRDAVRRHLADPRRVLQVRDTALVLAGHALNVVRRANDGSWCYAISLLDPGPTTATRKR